jgi:hypothetical protein
LVFGPFSDRQVWTSAFRAFGKVCSGQPFG